MFKNKKVLVIGGTGTIGSQLVKTLLKFEPNVVRVFSRDEYKQFLMQKRIGDNEKLRYLIGDVRDVKRLERAMDEIDIVFHLAAMKQVGACEYNPSEALMTNVIGVQNIIEAARKCNVERVIYTSSDKAINPVNTYGATKMLSEKLIVSEGSNLGSSKTRFSAVRFGNVMGSRGSVIPIFRENILNNELLNVTDPNMTRFMMTVHEAVGLLLKAAELSRGGDTFILKMPSIKLGDLIEAMYQELNHKHSVEKYKTNIIGLRIGEKMYEELMTIEESEKALDCDGMYIIPPYFREYDYGTHKKAKLQAYRSDDCDLIGIESIRDMINNSKFER